MYTRLDLESFYIEHTSEFSGEMKKKERKVGGNKKKEARSKVAKFLPAGSCTFDELQASQFLGKALSNNNDRDGR